VKRELAQEGNKTYRASADCTAGRITTIDGGVYTLAGVWDRSDIGGGRTKWKGADGAIVGRDNASNGLAISQQWELLCPGPPPLRAVNPSTTAGICEAGTSCTEVNSFAATVTDFRTSNVSRWKVVTATLRFQNKLARPIVLGYVNGSGTATDDHGNRYEANAQTIRGIGLINSGQVDPKFVLRPGESGDARFEMAWGWSGKEIFGLRFDMDLTVREVVPLQNGQLRLGPEHPLRFSGLTNNLRPPTLSSNTMTPASTPQPTSAPSVGPDPCSGIARCFNAGAFSADIQQITSSVASGRHHVLRFNVRLRNTTNQPLILAATYNSLAATDNQGNRYGMTPAQSVSGMGVAAGNRADPNFVLSPGQTRNVAFEVYRRNSGQPTGTTYTFDVSLEQLEILPSQQIRSTRQFALNFPNLSVSPLAGGAQAMPPAENLGEAGKKIVDVFRKKR
jgi:hypothetical protein